MSIVEYTEFLVKSICNEPDMIKVSSYEEENSIKIDILVPEKSLGILLGKDGRNIKSIRTLINAYMYLHEKKNAEIHVDSF